MLQSEPHIIESRVINTQLNHCALIKDTPLLTTHFISLNLKMFSQCKPTLHNRLSLNHDLFVDYLNVLFL